MIGIRDYIENGWALVPIEPGSKGPLRAGWNTDEAVVDSLDRLGQLDGQGVGLAHLQSGTAVLDLDDLDRAREWLKERGVDVDALLAAPDAVRIVSGRPGRAKLLYARRAGQEAPPTVQPRESGLELRCASRSGRTVQDAIPPTIHPDTGRPYEWAGAADPLRPPPLPDALLRIWNAELAGTGRPGADLPPSRSLSDRELARIRSAFRALDPDMPYHEWLGLGMAAHSTGDARCFDAWDEWSAGSGQYQPGECAEKWRGFAQGGGVTLGTLFQQAKAAGWKDPAPDLALPAIDADPTEIELADLFAARHAGALRYCAEWGRWLQWDGQRWTEERTLAAYDMAREVCQGAAAAAAKPGRRAKLAQANTVASVERLAKADRRMVATASQWDADPWILNTPGGLVDLRTGEMTPPEPRAYCTKMTAAAPGGECPRWLEFLDEATGGDRELVSYLQHVAGYALSGSMREHVFLFLHGPGGNGKSVFVNTLLHAMGDYAKVSAMETFTVQGGGDRHPTDLASLQGARLVVAGEVEDGRRFAESRIKQITGGDPISARRMRQDHFEFTPQCKLLLVGNHRPRISNTDEAMRRRLRLVPFTVTPRRRDPGLEESLAKEWPGILAWAVAGCLEWQRRGLCEPASVREATDEYFDSEDTLGYWLSEHCEMGPYDTPVADLYEDFAAFAGKSNEWAGNSRRFSDELDRRPGIERARVGKERTRCFRGLRLRGRFPASARGAIGPVGDVPQAAGGRSGRKDSKSPLRTCARA